MTWFVAQQSCEAAGKSLCSNSQWQAAAAGTNDPGGAGTNMQCNISATRRDTGLAGNTPGGDDTCVSMWGVEDMIGNLWEWTSDWSGQGANSDDYTYSVEYEGDQAWNVDPAQAHGTGELGLPAAALRGGDFDSIGTAGIFTLDYTYAPSYSDETISARCCLD